MAFNNDANKPDLQIGQTLLLILDHEKVIGELKLLKETHLRLINVHDYSTSEFIAANQVYYSNRIRSIKIIDETPTELLTNGDQDQESVGFQQSKSKNDHAVNMCLETIEHITDLLKNFIYIKMSDQKYFNAVKDIAKQRVIGINIENVECGRMAIQPSVLSIVTDRQIYIFDMVTLNGIPKELKKILSVSRPMKVVHYSKYITDFLKHNLHIDLNNVFDVMYAYMAVTGTKEVLSVQKVVENIFKLPEETPPSNLQWASRPLSIELKLIAAGNVSFLLELHFTLTNEYLLAPFFAKVNEARKQLSKQHGVVLVVKEAGKNECDPVQFDEVLQIAPEFEAMALHNED